MVDPIKELYAQGKLGVSRTQPHHLVSLDDEPDATPVPPSSIFLGEAAPLPVYRQPPAKRGSNYTPPKKRKKRRKK